MVYHDITMTTIIAMEKISGYLRRWLGIPESDQYCSKWINKHSTISIQGANGRIHGHKDQRGDDV